ncbi:hypothetical protein BH23ACT9_BH23ACT9_17630 [soil metagenome]
MTVIDEPAGLSAGEGRLRRLARLADVLSDAVTVLEATQAVVTAGADELEADSVTVCLLSGDGSGYTLAASGGLQPALAEQWRSFPVDAPVPVADAVRDNALIVIDGIEERERRYPVLGVGPTTSEVLVIAPMVVHEETPIGAMSVGFAEPRELSEVDRAFIQTAADLCGQAVHRARLFEYQQRALARQRFLADATTLLNAELDQDHTLGQMARLAVGELADVCAVCLCDDEQALRPVVAIHRDPEGQVVVDQLMARQPVITSPVLVEIAAGGQAVFMPVLGMAEQEANAEDEVHLQLIRALNATGVIIAPMRARGQVIGLLLLLLTGDSRTPDDDDRRVVEELAARSALALDNARLHEEQAELVEHLQTALSSHRSIEQAKGMLAARLDLTPGEAFERMRRHARANRRPIQDVATDVIDGTDQLGT